MSEKKFKVGDRVVGVGTYDNKNIDGEVGTVVYADKHSNLLGVEFDGNIEGHELWPTGVECKDGHGWWVSPEHLKPLTETWKVLIIPNGDKTTGKLYKNGKVVKSVETTKHPDDKYSIEEACKVIIDRMFEEEATYYNGKVVCVNSNNSFITQGKIYEFKDGHSIDDEGSRLPCLTRIKSFEHLNSLMWSDFIEVVE